MGVLTWPTQQTSHIRINARPYNSYFMVRIAGNSERKLTQMTKLPLSIDRNRLTNNLLIIRVDSPTSFERRNAETQLANCQPDYH